MFQEVVNDFIVPVGLYIMLLRIIEWASKIGKDFHCNRMHCNRFWFTLKKCIYLKEKQKTNKNKKQNTLPRWLLSENSQLSSQKTQLILPCVKGPPSSHFRMLYIRNHPEPPEVFGPLRLSLRDARSIISSVGKINMLS